MKITCCEERAEAFVTEDLWKSVEWKYFIRWMTGAKKTNLDMYRLLEKEETSFRSTLLIQYFITEIKRLIKKGIFDRYFVKDYLNKKNVDEVDLLERKIASHWPVPCQVSFLLLMRQYFSDARVFRSKYALLIELYEYHPHTFFHSIRVSVLAVWLGGIAGYSQRGIEELFEAALFHDIGKLHVAAAILNKPGPLCAEEKDGVKKHPAEGFRRLRGSQMFHYRVCRAVLEHHERYDGRGYPRELRGEYIHTYSRIISICDVYDALISDRIYKEACHPYEAFRIMAYEMTGFFDYDILNLFFDHIVVFPVGTVVRLSDHRRAVVVKVNQGAYFSPVVKIFDTGSAEEANVDLSRDSLLYVTEILADKS